MRRPVMLLLLLFVVVAGCSALTWTSVRPPIARLVPPNARDIRLQAIGMGRWLLTYEVSGSRSDWYFTIANRLADSGWSQPSKWGPPAQLNTYTQVTPLWIGFLWEQVELRGEANRARITLRRWIVFLRNPLIDYVNI